MKIKELKNLISKLKDSDDIPQDIINQITNSCSYNSGDHNSGDHNSGWYNSGSSNSGDSNSGDSNSGNCNSGHYNSGYFNTNEPTVRMFNKDTTLYRKDIDLPYIELPLTEYDDKTKTLITRTYKEAWKLAWSKLDNKTKDKFKNLPNFDNNIFEEITGINIKQEYDKEYGIDFIERLRK